MRQSEEEVYPHSTDREVKVQTRGEVCRRPHCKGMVGSVSQREHGSLTAPYGCQEENQLAALPWYTPPPMWLSTNGAPRKDQTKMQLAFPAAYPVS